MRGSILLFFGLKRHRNFPHLTCSVSGFRFISQYQNEPKSTGRFPQNVTSPTFRAGAPSNPAPVRSHVPPRYLVEVAVLIVAASVGAATNLEAR